MGKALVAGLVVGIILVVCIIAVVVLVLPGLGGAGGAAGPGAKEVVAGTQEQGGVAVKTYSAVDIGKGVRSQRSVSVDVAGGKKVSLFLTGLQRGMSVKERIPKSFADNANKIRFSRQPTQVLEADPLVVWKFDEIVSGESINITYELPGNSVLVSISDLLDHVGDTVVLYGHVTRLWWFGGYEPARGTDAYWDMQEAITIEDHTGSVKVTYYVNPPRAQKPDVGDEVTVTVYVSEYEGEPILVMTAYTKGWDFATIFPEGFETPSIE